MNDKITFSGCKYPERGIAVDKIEFFNSGSHENPGFGVRIFGRCREDLKTKAKVELFDNEAENFEAMIENEINASLK